MSKSYKANRDDDREDTVSKSAKNYKGKRKKKGAQNRSQYSKSAPKSDNSRLGMEDEASSRADRRYNDPAWYSQSNQLLLDAGKISFNNGAGYPIRMASTGPDKELISPGVMALYYIPTVGSSYNASSAVNTAARNIYSYVRHVNSGHANYDAPDLMLYILGVSELYAFYHWMQRVYGCMGLYSQRNAYIPRTLIRAMGLDYDSILSNLADFKFFINTFGKRLASFTIPDSLSILYRQSWMCSYIYTDSDDIKSQLYMYQPLGFHMHSLDSEGKGMLRFQQWYHPGSATLKSYQDLTSYAYGLLSSISGSEDWNIMAGDIIKAYGVEHVLRLSMITDDYTVVPVSSEEVGYQFKNSTFPIWTSAAKHVDGEYLNVDVTQELGDFESGPYLKSLDGEFRMYLAPGVANVYNNQAIMVSPVSNPDPTEVIVNSRMCVLPAVLVEPDEPNVCKFKLLMDEVGTEIPFMEYIYTYEPSMHGVVGYAVSSDVNLDSTPFDDLRGIALSTWFKYAPNNIVSYCNADGETVDARQYFVKADNFTTVDRETLRKMHFTATMSEFNVPLAGAWNQ